MNEKAKMVNLQFYTQENVCFKNKGEIKTFSDMGKNSLLAGLH